MGAPSTKLLDILLLLLLRGPADAGADSAEAVAFGLPQALLTLGLISLLVVLGVMVVWRARSTSRTRSK